MFVPPGGDRSGRGGGIGREGPQQGGNRGRGRGGQTYGSRGGGGGRGGATGGSGGVGFRPHGNNDKNIYINLVDHLRSKELLPMVVFVFSRKR